MEKQIKIALYVLATIFIISGCSSDATTDVKSSTLMPVQSEPQGDSKNVDIIVSTKVMGQVTEIFGNELTLQVGIMEGGAQSSVGGREPIGEGTPPAGGAKSTGGEASKAGGRSSSGGASEGGARPSGSGGASGGESIADSIELSEELREFSIPITAPVEQFGMEISFSQIYVDSYITITLDEADNVLSVSVLG